MTDHDSVPEIIMDFDSGVDSIEFLIQSFGYDEINVLEQIDEESVAVDPASGRLQLVDVNASGLGTDSFTFGSNAIPGKRLTSD